MYEFEDGGKAATATLPAGKGEPKTVTPATPEAATGADELPGGRCCECLQWDRVHGTGCRLGINGLAAVYRGRGKATRWDWVLCPPNAWHYCKSYLGDRD